MQEEAEHWAGNTDFQQIVKLKTTQGREGEEGEREKERDAHSEKERRQQKTKVNGG